MKRTRDREGKSAGTHARPPERRRPHPDWVSSRRPSPPSSSAIPVGPAVADPKPSLKALSKQAEELHTEIETLSEQYNGQREKLKTAKKAPTRPRRRWPPASPIWPPSAPRPRCWPRTPT